MFEHVENTRTSEGTLGGIGTLDAAPARERLGNARILSYYGEKDNTHTSVTVYVLSFGKNGLISQLETRARRFLESTSKHSILCGSEL